MPQRLVSIQPRNSFDHAYLESLLTPYFVVDYDVDRLDPRQDVLLWNWPWPEPNHLVWQFLDSGGRVIADGLWERYVPGLWTVRSFQQQVLLTRSGAPESHEWFPTVTVEDWFWYNEALWYHSRGYHEYRPQREFTYRFLMPIRRADSDRLAWVQRIQPHLDNAIWSLVDHGRHLPGYTNDQLDDQRLFLPEWYDQTGFSMVVETTQDDLEPRFITEKTYKPLAFFHPFMVLGQQGTLAHLHTLGFETWPELFDESYDLEPDAQRRQQIIAQQLDCFNPGVAANHPAVQQKLKHNHARFFDLDLVQQRIHQQLIEPILEFLENTA